MFLAYRAIRDYTNAILYGKKVVLIQREIGQTADEGTLALELAEICENCKHTEAKVFYERAISIMIKTRNRQGLANAYEKFGRMSYRHGEYAKAQEYVSKALAIRMEIGDRQGEANDRTNLGIVFQALGNYGRARECQEKALAISIENGNRHGEARAYANLGIVFQSVDEHVKAKEYLEKALAIRIETGDRKGQAEAYGHLGIVSQSLGEDVKAKEYFEKAIPIRIEIGEKRAEATDYTYLGTVYDSLGERAKAKEYLEKALAIGIEIGDRNGQAAAFRNLGTVLRSLGEYVKAREYQENALAITLETGDRRGEASSYVYLGNVYQSLGDFVRAKEYLEKALAIRIETSDRIGEAEVYVALGNVSQRLGEYANSTEYLEKSFSITQDNKYVDTEFYCLCNLALVKLHEGKIQEAVNCLRLAIENSEDLRVLLQNSDESKISFSEVHFFPYLQLRELFITTEYYNDGLYVEELGRARALADLMADQYSLRNDQISSNPQSWLNIENIMRKESSSACLYISYDNAQVVNLWIIKTSGITQFCRMEVNEKIFCGELGLKLDDFFAESFRRFGILPEEDCEDRSLNKTEPRQKSFQEESDAAMRLVEEDDEQGQHYESRLSLCYRMLIGPAIDLLGNEKPEIIVFPPRFLYHVPFAALQDENGKYLSETYRLRIVPSLATLKLIQNSPADYHSETGALVVGDPKVGQVYYRGRLENFKSLEYARAEAKMVGQLMGVQPLLGEQATKQAVLDRIHSVSLVHFAAHGNAERGEIALAPNARSATQVPNENDYLLTMSDISRVQLRAKLVVLSCCHSGRGQIWAEGVVGIARAFLGSGARSVLVARWALEDRATLQLMRQFYQHLADGGSASESLHEAMKWMRANGFPDVADWAPFMLIGDNVTLQFGK